MLVVISIIGLLASVVLVSLNGARKKARDAVRKQTLRQLQKALEMYYTNNRAYPDTSMVWQSSEPDDCASSPPGGYIPGLVPVYVSKLPSDPLGGFSSHPECNPATACAGHGWKRSFLYKSDGKDYKLLALCGQESITTPDDSLNDLFRDGGPRPTDIYDPVSCDSGAGKTDMYSGDGTSIWSWAVYSTSRSKCW